MRVALVVVLLLLVAGCAQREQGAAKPDESVMPADFAGVVEYGNGSLPPPYHYEWRLTFDATTATLEWKPGYESGTRPWKETAEITADQRRKLYRELRDAGAFTFDDHTDEGITGGPTGKASLTARDRTHDTGPLGLNRSGQRVLDDVVAAVEVLVPAETWASLKQRQEEWGSHQ